VNGQLRVQLQHSVHDVDDGVESMSVGTRLDDNVWHTVRLIYRSRSDYQWRSYAREFEAAAPPDSQ